MGYGEREMCPHNQNQMKVNNFVNKVCTNMVAKWRRKNISFEERTKHQNKTFMILMPVPVYRFQDIIRFDCISSKIEEKNKQF